MLTRHVSRERCFNRFPEQWFAGELTSRRVNLAYPYRLTGSLEHHRHGLEYRTRLGGDRPRFTGIDRGPTEKLVVESVDSRKLNPGLRVRTCSV